MKEKNILLLGIGNLLMGDEGVGIHVVQRLEKESLPENVRVLDGGTGGFHLLEYFQLYETIIIIDATNDGKPPGTVSVLKPQFSSEYPRTLTAHDIGLRDLIESASLIESLPTVYLVIITIDTIHSMTMNLSVPVREAIPEAVRMVVEITKNIYIEVNYSGEE